MSGRLRRLLQSVPVGDVRHGHIREQVFGPADPLVPTVARRLVERFLERQFADTGPVRAQLAAAGRLMDQALIDATLSTAPAAESDPRHPWLIVGDALASAHDPVSTLETHLRHAGKDASSNLLVIFPGTALAPDDMEPAPRRWLFSPVSARRLAEQVCPSRRIAVGSLGNALTATAELVGLAPDQLSPSDLDAHDPEYPVIVTMTASES